MRIAVFGSGGAGGYFGAQLARAGEDVIFIARGEHAQAIRTQGLRVETPKGELVIRPARASDNPAEVGVVDAVIVGVKAWQVTDAAHAMQPMVGPETFVIPLQNGVTATSQLAAVLGAEHVLGAYAAQSVGWSVQDTFAVSAKHILSNSANWTNDPANAPSDCDRHLREPA